MLSGQNLFCQSFDLAYVRTHSSKIIIIIIIIIIINFYLNLFWRKIIIIFINILKKIYIWYIYS